MSSWHVVRLAAVEIGPIAAWIKAIALTDWPQQNPRGQLLKPAMVTDLNWHNFGAQTDELVAGLLAWFPNCRAVQRMLSAVMPQDTIPPHVDEQRPEWVCRIHVPLLTNASSYFYCGGNKYAMRSGAAYKVNTRSEHAVENFGAMPRIHFMFDVLQ